MPNTYKDFVVKVTIEQGEGEEGQVIKTPFTRYQETVWCEDVDVTYQYHTDPKLLGKTCVMFCQVIDEHPTLPSEVKTCEEYKDTMGISEIDIKTRVSEEEPENMVGKIINWFTNKVNNAELLSLNVVKSIVVQTEPIEEVIEK